MQSSEIKQKRHELLCEILTDLYDLKRRGHENSYALNANIRYFESVSSFSSYMRWLFFEMPNLDGEKLLELSDFHLRNGEWEKILQKELLEVEQWDFPDLLKQLRFEILKTLEALTNATRPLLLVNIGAGAMEIDRQIINFLKKQKNQQKIVFIGIDNSQESLDVARINLSGCGVPIEQLTELNAGTLESLQKHTKDKNYVVGLYKGEAAELKKIFAPKSIDLLYFSKFKHHLPKDLKNHLDELIEFAALNAIEFDNRNGWFMKFVPIKANWHQPVLLNGGVFSCLRTPTKHQLLSSPRKNWDTKIFIDGYLRKYSAPQPTIDKLNLTEIQKRILEAAIKAPSGDNCQPWQFKIQNGVIYTYYVPQKDMSLYNFQNFASWTALGAAFENIKIASSQHGQTAKIDLQIDNSENPYLIAKISFTNSGPKIEPLYNSIAERCTNRKPYLKNSVDKQQLAELQQVQTEQIGLKLFLTNKPSDIAILAEAVSKNESVLFDNPIMRKFFFSHINWTKKEDQKKGFGFYIETLEMPPPAKVIMKLYQHTLAAKIFSKLQLPNVIAKQNAQTYQACGAFGMILVPEINSLNYFKTGELLEKIWLTATKMQLSLQPLTGIPLLNHRITLGNKNYFSPQELSLIFQNYQTIKKLFNVAGGEVALLFRIGKSSPPSAKTVRQDLTQVIK